ncbi:unnamed protein product [Eruca vesicaria subsp. sativa]|uniref:Uncharacterized protein n=1 Tax=Eruca vesicaria subsp. sativa TaxID=29727 RepID=A0ABC8JY37_ERUVS|nr:unnamed protein product [Eruca vesicaria subsp. sativa]
MEDEKKPAMTEKTTEQEVKKDDVPNIKSPYFDYNNMEDFKMRDYGHEGHEEPEVDLGGGSTDPLIPSGGVGRGGGAASSDLSSTGTINRQGVP